MAFLPSTRCSEFRTKGLTETATQLRQKIGEFHKEGAGAWHIGWNDVPKGSYWPPIKKQTTARFGGRLRRG
jgi:hypothetical protein